VLLPRPSKIRSVLSDCRMVLISRNTPRFRKILANEIKAGVHQVHRGRKNSSPNTFEVVSSTPDEILQKAAR